MIPILETVDERSSEVPHEKNREQEEQKREERENKFHIPLGDDNGNGPDPTQFPPIVQSVWSEGRARL